MFFSFGENIRCISRDGVWDLIDGASKELILRPRLGGVQTASSARPCKTLQLDPKAILKN